ncbi:MAG: hypothetical protein ACRDLQ_09135 [Solirubrobacterales bacterium]
MRRTVRLVGGLILPAGADYTGELEGRVTLRITDTFNATAPGGGTDHAPMTDYTLRLPMPIPCARDGRRQHPLRDPGHLHPLTRGGSLR